ncbi:MAG TPA: hypothetical protein VFT22_38480, partial [Kofleriaceae bacterium]|nr:hypothetical protein [Kofleriaceae bacterium]
SGPAPAASSPPGMPPSGRFPDLANLPTVIAEHDPGIVAHADEPGAAAHAPANLAGAPVPDLAKTQIAPVPNSAGAPSSGAHGPPPAAPGPSRPHATPPGAPSSGAHGPPPAAPGPSRPHAAPPPSAAPPSGPQGYPVLSPELSAQIATGATVFPSESPGSLQVPPSAPHASPRLSDPAEGYARAPVPPRAGDAGPGQPARDPNDAQRAANLMSPVGPRYGEPVDWSAAAAAPARAVPPWLLAILFIGALGIALTLTIVIAKLIR